MNYGSDIRDYYKILGLPIGASLKEVHQAYKGLTQEGHPDHPKIQRKTDEELKIINHAYEQIIGFIDNLSKFKQAQGATSGDGKAEDKVKNPNQETYNIDINSKWLKYVGGFIVKVKKKTAKVSVQIALALTMVILIIFVFRYKDKVYIGMKFRYDRFTKKVYVANAYDTSPEWIETICLTIDQCIEHERRRVVQEKFQAIEDALEERADEIKRNRDDMEDMVSRQRNLQFFKELIK